MRLHILALTHRNFEISQIGNFHLSDEDREGRLRALKKVMKLEELLYLSTCNRVEFIFTTSFEVNQDFLRRFFGSFSSGDLELTEKAVKATELFSGDAAIEHLFSVASSLDSLVVGEREIITQVRRAFEESVKYELSGDTIRLLIHKTIEIAKGVYTETTIARNPVSVVSLAYRKLRELNVKLDARVLIIGSGVTNTAMARYLKKHGYTDFVVFNRTVANAEKLAKELNCESHSLSRLASHTKGFDVIVTCTGSNGVIITPEIYSALNGQETSKKVVIDLAVPNDLDDSILNNYDINLIAINNLQEVAKNNLRQREDQLDHCNSIIAAGISEYHVEFRQRQVEIAMSAVPEKVKEIHHTAVNSVFAKDIAKLDPDSKEVLDKVLAYIEKKYISVPMKMAREILKEEANQN